MQRLFAWCDAALLTWCLLLMGVMTLLQIAAVLLRYFFGLTYVWSEELITLLFVATTFFGAVLCFKNNEHIVVDNFFLWLPSGAQRTLRITLAIVVIAMQILVIAMSLRWIAAIGEDVTPGLRIPAKYVYLMVPITAGLTALYELRSIVALAARQTDLPSNPATTVGQP